MPSKTSHSIFRFRSYQMPDGTVREVFGDGPEPDGAVKLLGDDTIEQTTTRTSNMPQPQ